jgi:hypothetical protein
VKSTLIPLPVHDFFKPQPVKNASVYFLRSIIHDWPDAEAKKILKNLREAADTRAIHTFEDPSSSTKGKDQVIYPLLANLGIGGVGFATALDMQVVAPSLSFCSRLLTCMYVDADFV